MKKANEQLKRHLDKELEQIQFSRQVEVMNKITRITWKDKLHRLWNKEITIPLIPISAVLALCIVLIGYKEKWQEEPKNTNSGVLITVAGSYYWKEDLERMMSENEN